MHFSRTARVAVCAATIAAGTLAGVAGTSGQAGAAAVVSAPRVNWQARTCAAERAWAARPSYGRLVVVLADSVHVPWRYVGQDAAGLYGDVRSKAPAKYLLADERYFAADCNAV